jgi:hypothetical protein
MDNWAEAREKYVTSATWRIANWAMHMCNSFPIAKEVAISILATAFSYSGHLIASFSEQEQHNGHSANGRHKYSYIMHWQWRPTIPVHIRADNSEALCCLIHQYLLWHFMVILPKSSVNVLRLRGNTKVNHYIIWGQCLVHTAFNPRCGFYIKICNKTQCNMYVKSVTWSSKLTQH